jgi:hypothetical protein
VGGGGGMGTRVRRVGEIRRNPFFHNQWQVGKFLPQKPLKAGGEVLLHLYYDKSCFWAKASRRLSPLVAFDFCKSKNRL